MIYFLLHIEILLLYLHPKNKPKKRTIKKTLFRATKLQITFLIAKQIKTLILWQKHSYL